MMISLLILHMYVFIESKQMIACPNEKLKWYEYGYGYSYGYSYGHGHG